MKGVKNRGLVNFEYPQFVDIEKIKYKEERDLHVSGFSCNSTYGRFNVLLSTGDHSKVADWNFQKRTMVDKSSKVAQILVYFNNSTAYPGSKITPAFEFLDNYGKSLLKVGSAGTAP